jgi:hypothetical protein
VGVWDGFCWFFGGVGRFLEGLGGVFDSLSGVWMVWDRFWKVFVGFLGEGEGVWRDFVVFGGLLGF